MSTPARYVPGYSERFLAFLERRRAETHAAGLLPHLAPGMRLLDCGCGPGTITMGLARAVAPGETVAVDREQHQVERTRRRARELGLERIRVQAADVDALPFPDAAFDAVHAHALLEHLSEPVAALAEMRRVLRPGGPLAVAVPDFPGFVLAPSRPEVDGAFAYYVRLRAEAGGEPRAGRHLGGWLVAAGLVGVALGAWYEVHEPRAPLAHHIADRIAASPSEDAGDWVATPAEADAMASALREWSERPPGLLAQCWVTALARAPEGT